MDTDQYGHPRFYLFCDECHERTPHKFGFCISCAGLKASQLDHPHRDETLPEVRTSDPSRHVA